MDVKGNQPELLSKWKIETFVGKKVSSLAANIFGSVFDNKIEKIYVKLPA